MTVQEEIQQEEIRALEKIVTFLDRRYRDIFFDIDSERLGGRNLYKIYVSDLKFYLEDQKFKSICKALKNKFSYKEGDIWLIFVFQNNRFQ